MAMPSDNNNIQMTTIDLDDTEQGLKSTAADQQQPPNPADELNSFWERQSKLVARYPCLHLWTFLGLAIVNSIIAMTIGEFEISTEDGGWQSRGTMIADRQTQLMLAVENQEYLFYGGKGVWDNLLNNVQPGWEQDYDYDRRLEQISDVDFSFVDLLRPQSDRLQSNNNNKHRGLPFWMTNDLKRRLQDESQGGGVLEGCNMDWYSASNLTGPTRLWPIWKNAKKASTTLDPEILHDICVAEQNTQSHLEEKGLCFGGCKEEGKCLPPYSIVLYARLTVPNGMSLTCEELQEAWAPYQEPTELQWKTCVQDIKSNYDPNDEGGLPDSCPFGFLPTLVDESFDLTSSSTYSSSIFATEWYNVDEIYEEVDYLDTGSELVKGTYDTQYEDFVGLKLDASLTSDMTLALGSAVIVAVAIVIHTRSPFLTLIGLVQIILSFPLAYFFYKLIAGLDFFPFLNFIGIFVVFALGAGDIFVAVDKWKNARLEHPSASTEYIAAVALPDAASAMFLTTLTTAVAFFATAICPVAPIKMFAIFCALLIILDYTMNVLLVFPALCIYDRALVAKSHDNVSCCITWTCCGLFAPKLRDDDDDDDGDGAAEDVVEAPPAKNSYDDDFKPTFIRRILLWFYDGLHFVRWPLFAICVFTFILTAYYASTLEVSRIIDFLFIFLLADIRLSLICKDANIIRCEAAG